MAINWDSQKHYKVNQPKKQPKGLWEKVFSWLKSIFG
jgi:hypothetical protein